MYLKNIESKYNELFSIINFIFFKTKYKSNVSSTVQKLIYAATNNTVDGRMYNISYEFVEDNKINVMFIFDKNSEIPTLKKDEFIIDNKITRVYIVPHNVVDEDFDHLQRIKIIYAIIR